MSAKNHDDELVTIAIVDRATMAEVMGMTVAPEFKIPAQSSKPVAADTYAKQVRQINAKLDVLRVFAGSRLDAIDPEEINWGHVGDLASVIASLDELLMQTDEIAGKK